MSKTLFVDIDGTILYHHFNSYPVEEAVLLPGVQEKFDEWVKDNCHIVLVTARDESHRELTEAHLAKFNLPYHRLYMGFPDFPRYVINDEKRHCDSCGHRIVKRDKGLEDLDI